MNSIENLVVSGDIVIIMLAFIALEIIGIEVYRRLRGAGIATIPLLVNIGAGGSLMLALRATLTDAGWQWIAVFLVSSLVFHVSDLAIRWRPTANVN